MTSRERMLAALSCRVPDRVPCAFMLFGALRKRVRTQEEFVDKALAMGLDAFVELPVRPPGLARKGHDHYDLYGLPVRYHPAAVIRDGREDGADAAGATVRREYRLPSGTLSAAVAVTEDWPHGDRVPLFDDYVIPRSTKRLVTGREDLPALRELLALPTADDLAAFRAEAARAKAFAKSRDLLVVGEWGVLFDAASWLCGIEEMAMFAIEDEAFVAELLDVIGTWNLKREAILLEAGVDLLVRRAWYETTDFLSPERYRRLLLPWVKREAEQAHQAGAKLGGITSSAYTPLLGCYLEAGLDVLIGLDPVQDPRCDFALTKRTLGGKVCLWGGVNGYHTIEQGKREGVGDAVRAALATLAPGGGFILSPVDNVREDIPRAWENVEAFVAAWREATAG